MPPSVAELSQAVAHAPCVVAQRAPGLVLGAVSKLVSEHRQRVATRVGQKDIVAQGDGAPAGEPKHEGTERTAGRPARAAMEPHARKIDGKREPGKRALLGSVESARATVSVFCSPHVTSPRQPRVPYRPLSPPRRSS